jgi:hypothetical protein
MLHRSRKGKIRALLTGDIKTDILHMNCNCRHLTSSKTNYCFLNTPQKILRMRKLHSDVKVSQQRVKCLMTKLADKTELNGVTVDSELHSDLSSICNNAASNSMIMEKHPPGSFERIFWEQQVKACMQYQKCSLNEMASSYDSVVYIFTSLVKYCIWNSEII